MSCIIKKRLRPEWPVQYIEVFSIQLGPWLHSPTTQSAEGPQIVRHLIDTPCPLCTSPSGSRRIVVENLFHQITVRQSGYVPGPPQSSDFRGVNDGWFSQQLHNGRNG
ncbi:uncharacterized protein LOC134214268 [Armigeres subalbatus]|uniref:uncharacterized protein LOC134214268 n=1 Tax=Armigeres subalbatus TaxID=124917 RepID=UPI002ED44F36